MVTPFGKELRLLRLERDELLKDMADNLGVTPAYLSSIENGKRQPTEELVEKLFSRYRLSKDEKDDILEAKSRTVREVHIDFSKSKKDSEELGLLFARKFDGLTPEQIENITALLKKKPT